MRDGLIGIGHFNQELAGQWELGHGCAMLPCKALVCQGLSRARFELFHPNFKIRLWLQLRILKCGHSLSRVNIRENADCGSIWLRGIDMSSRSVLLSNSNEN